MKNITIEQLKERMDKNEELNIIDVREEWEYDDFNIGAKNIPLSELPSRISELDDLKNKEIIIHCQMGGRSAHAAAFLEQTGFTNVVNVTTGMHDWKQKFGRGA